MKDMWKETTLSTREKRAMYEHIVVPTVLYGAEKGEKQPRCFGNAVPKKYKQNNNQVQSWK